MLVICAILVPYISSQKVEEALHNKVTCVANSFSIRRKHFAGNFSACVFTNNEYTYMTKLSKCTFVEASKVTN